MTGLVSLVILVVVALSRFIPLNIDFLVVCVIAVSTGYYVGWSDIPFWSEAIIALVLHTAVFFSFFGRMEMGWKSGLGATVIAAVCYLWAYHKGSREAAARFPSDEGFHK